MGVNLVMRKELFSKCDNRAREESCGRDTKVTMNGIRNMNEESEMNQACKTSVPKEEYYRARRSLDPYDLERVTLCIIICDQISCSFFSVSIVLHLVEAYILITFVCFHILLVEGSVLKFVGTDLFYMLLFPK